MDLSGAVWRKSSYGREDGGAWIEITFLPGSEISDEDSRLTGLRGRVPGRA